MAYNLFNMPLESVFCHFLHYLSKEYICSLDIFDQYSAGTQSLNDDDLLSLQILFLIYRLP